MSNIIPLRDLPPIGNKIIAFTADIKQIARQNVLSGTNNKACLAYSTVGLTIVTVHRQTGQVAYV